MRSDFRLSQIVGYILFGSLMFVSCTFHSSDFMSFMKVPLPSTVEVVKVDGNWGKDPWRCWELSPVNEKLKQDLIATWSLIPNPKAFNGVASGGQVYCKYDRLDESYSGSSDSYRAVGVRDNKMVVFFYNG